MKNFKFYILLKLKLVNIKINLHSRIENVIYKVTKIYFCYNVFFYGVVHLLKLDNANIKLTIPAVFLVLLYA